MIFPLVKEMLAHLEENIAKGTQKTFCQALKNEVVKYFAYVIDPDSCDFDPFYVCSTYLDPFYMGVLDDKMMNVAKNGLKKLMVVEITRGEDTEDKLASNVEIKEESDEDDKDFEMPWLKHTGKSVTQMEKIGKEQVNLQELFDRDLNIYEEKVNEVIQKAKLKAKLVYAEEKEKLLKVGKADEAMKLKKKLELKDPLDFWEQQEWKVRYETILPTLAQDIMVVPASSVPSERTFSITGVLSSGKFSTIKPETLEMRMIVKCNSYLN